MFDAIKYQLYLLQLENYELRRYFSLLRKRGIFPPKRLRGQLKWTGKARLLLGLAIFVHVIISIAATMVAYSFYFDFWVTSFTFLFLIIALSFLYFLFFAVALELIYPLQFYLKSKIINEAQDRLKKLDNLKVIGIAGSYGKTSMKEALKSVLAEQFEVASTPESVNTPLGVAKFINEKVDDGTRVLIVEMGEHYSGDVMELCQLVRPDIGVIAGINESHLERLNDLSVSIATVFEMASGIKDGGLLVLNADDKNVVGNYQKFTAGKKMLFYSSHENSLCNYQIKDHRFSPDELVNYFSISRDGETVGNFKSKILGEYVLGLSVACAIIGKELGMNNAKIVAGFDKLKPVAHRLEPIINPNGLIVIDDSYNGNPDGVREAIKLLSQFEGRRKVYLTPGLVEMGKSAQAVHLEIGKELAGKVDLVMLVKNSVTPFIEEGLKESGFDHDKILWYDSADSAHKSLDTVLNPGDVIMFQNDWGDQYL